MEAGDLKKDLGTVLSDLERKSRTDFCHYSTHTHIPLPSLNIENFGLVGLPLAARDAVSIIHGATAGPLGTGTWEVLPERMAIGNPEWNSFVDNLVRTQICPQFGVSPEVVRCELDKLVLCQQGSRFNNQTESPGTFAALAIILPSDFEGGELRVSYSGPVAVCDPSQNSVFNTTCIAWYTDGTSYEALPLTSGCSLSLCYNLIHVPSTSDDPPPSLPNMTQAALSLHNVLFRWKRWQYSPSDPLVLGYILEGHRYDSSGQPSPAELLSDADRKFLHCVLVTAQHLGIAVCIGQVKHTVSGFWYNAKHPESDPDRHTKLLRLLNEQLIITGCSFLGNSTILANPARPNDLNTGSIVQGSNYFWSRDWDAWIHDPVHTSGPCLHHIYYRTVLILRVDRRELVPVLIELHSIAPSISLPPRAKELVFYGLAHLDRYNRLFKVSEIDFNAYRGATWFLLHYAASCRCLDLWNRVFIHLQYAALCDSCGSAVQMGLQVFGQWAILPSIIELIPRLERVGPTLGCLVGLYCSIEAASRGWCTTDWLYEITKRILGVYIEIVLQFGAGLDDTQGVLFFASKWGLGNVVCNIIIPSIRSTTRLIQSYLQSYLFLGRLARYLHEHCNQGQWASVPPDTQSVQGTIYQCVWTAMDRGWEVILAHLESDPSLPKSNSKNLPASTSSGTDAPPPTVSKLVGPTPQSRWSPHICNVGHMLALCSAVRDIHSCAFLFNGLLMYLDSVTCPSDGSAPWPFVATTSTSGTKTGGERLRDGSSVIFEELIHPIILLIKLAFMKKHQISVAQPPFVGFFKRVVELYMLHVLGEQSSVSEDTWETRQSAARRWLSGCFKSENQKEAENKGGEEGEGRPEDEDKDEDDDWWTREELEELKMIMGERYDDLRAAVDGVKVYPITFEEVFDP